MAKWIDEQEGYGRVKFRTSAPEGYDPTPEGGVWLVVEDPELYYRSHYLLPLNEVRAALDKL